MQKNRQTALLGRGAGTPYEYFAPGKTAAQTEFISADHFKSKDESRLWRLEPKKKDMTCGCPLTGVTLQVSETPADIASAVSAGDFFLSHAPLAVD